MRSRLCVAVLMLFLGSCALTSAASGTRDALGRGVRVEATTASCPAESKPAVIGGNFKCLRAGQRCSARFQASYKKYGFHCVAGRLRRGTGAKPTPPPTPEPPPPPAPAPAALDGHYKGTTSQNETFEFDIVNGGTAMRGLKTGQINQGCTPPLHIYGNYVDLGDYSVSVTLGGDFSIAGRFSYWYVGPWPASTDITIRGRMAGQVGSGSLELNTTFTDGSNGVTYRCGSGLQTWSVTRAG